MTTANTPSQFRVVAAYSDEPDEAMRTIGYATSFGAAMEMMANEIRRVARGDLAELLFKLCSSDYAEEEDSGIISQVWRESGDIGYVADMLTFTVQDFDDWDLEDTEYWHSMTAEFSYGVLPA